jgi:phosphoribosylformylglycinamidine cyclo-ligase
MVKRYSDIVEYSVLDPVKRKAIETFTSTLAYPERLGIIVKGVGETAAVLDFLDYDFMVAFNVEGLGTKNLIADTMYEELKNKLDVAGEVDVSKYYANIGQDALAMAVTDILAVGAEPIAYADVIASGDSSWFRDEERVDALLAGYKMAADLAGCAIPQGETSTLKEIVAPRSLDIAGCAIGIIRPKSRFISGQKLKPGDAIYGLPSNGICANGVSKARMIASRLPEGYFTKLPNGQTLGEALLTPTPIYVRPIITLLEEGIDVHYISPITGHGWRKLSRPRLPLRYVIESLPEPPLVFRSLIELGGKYGFDVSDEENFQVWNMGIFIALMAPREYEDAIASIMDRYGVKLHVLGHVDEGEGEVVIKPNGVVYRGLGMW